MTGERRPAFHKTKVRKVPTNSDISRREASPVTTATAATSTSSAGKRPAPEEGRPKAFAPRKKHAAQQPKQVERVIISEEPPAASSPSPSAPVVAMNIPPPPSLQEMPSFPSSSLPEDGADSGPKVSAGYSANFLNLPYTLPGGLQVIEYSTKLRYSFNHWSLVSSSNPIYL
ncbi:hypothetical protein LIER_24224 [Lithospermum erythrorhizon]